MSIFRKLRFAFYIASITSTVSLSRCDSAKQVVSEVAQFVSAPVTRDSSEEGATANPPYDEVAATVVEGARSLIRASTAQVHEAVAIKGAQGSPSPDASRRPAGQVSTSGRTGRNPTFQAEPGKQSSSQ